MAQVPYQPYPTGQPLVSGERVDVQTTPSQFGANIGAALEHLGTTFDHVGGELFQRAVAMQELQNETWARNGDAQYTLAQDQMLVDIRSLQGDAAQKALESFGQRSNELRMRIRNSLPNADAQRRYDASSLGVMNRNVISASIHAATQLRDYHINEAKGYLIQQTKSWADPTDQTEVDDKIKKQDEALDTMANAQAEGWGPKKVDAEKFVAHSGVYAAQINELGQIGKVEDGFRKLEEYRAKNLLTQPDADAALAHLQQRNIGLGTRMLVNNVMAEAKKNNWGPEKMRQEIEKRSPALDHNDSRFLEAALHYFRGQVGVDRALARDEDHRNLTIIRSLIANNRVNDTADLQNDPQGGPAYAALSEEEKDKMPRTIAQAKLTRDMETRERTLMELNGLRMRDKDAYLRINPLDPALPLSMPDRKEVLRNQAALIKEPWNDPHVRQAKDWLNREYKTAMQTAGVFFAPPKGLANPDYDALLGNIEQSINAWKDTHNGQAPDEVTFKQKIAPGLMKMHAEPGFFGYVLGGRQVEEFRRTIEPAAVEKIRKEMIDDARAVGEEVEPTEDEVRNRIVHDHWIEYYQKKGLTSGGRGTGIPE